MQFGDCTAADILLSTKDRFYKYEGQYYKNRSAINALYDREITKNEASDLIFGKDLDAAALLTNGNVPGMVGIATPYPTSTLDTQGSVATRFSSVLIDTTLGEKDHTLLTNNATTITLPDPSTCNGRTYIIIYGSGGTSTISSNIIIGGSTVSNFQINSTAGNRGVNLQSSGSAWYVTNLF